MKCQCDKNRKIDYITKKTFISSSTLFSDQTIFLFCFMSSLSDERAHTRCKTLTIDIEKFDPKMNVAL